LNPVLVLVFAASALFAWAMGSHYTGSVAGTVYGAGVLSVRTALVITAVCTVLGSVANGVNVIGTYANVVSHAPEVDIAAAQMAAALVTTCATYFKLPTSTIQLYAFSILGMALVAGLPVHAATFGVLVVGWIAGPLGAFVLGFLLARAGMRIAQESARVLAWFLIVAVIFSAFTLGSNDVSNAASSLVQDRLFSPRVAALWGGAFMALGVLTWGRRLLERIGRDILPLDVPLAATAQLSKAATLSALNALGYNASINQTIVGGLTGVGTAVARPKLNRNVLRNITLTWFWSPLLGLGCSALMTVMLHMIIGH
jgi:PiT family inorganic phosphate transporter